LSFSSVSLTKDELRQYRQQFIENYIKVFDMHLRQLVDIRNKIFSHVRQMDELLNNYSPDVVRFDLYSDFLSALAHEPVPDKWQIIFDEVIRKVINNIVEFNNLNVIYLDDHSFDMDKKIIHSIKNS
jgi:hypothetical protein